MAQIRKIELGGELPTSDIGEIKESPELQAKLSQGSVTGSMFIDIGNVTSEVALTLERAHALAEHTAAKTQYSIEQDKVMQDMEENPNYSEEQKKQYIDRLNSAKEAAAQKISLPNARGAFMADANAHIQIAGHKISKEYNKRIKNEYQANLNYNITENYKNGYATADMTDTMAAEQFLQQMHTDLQEGVAAKMITPKEADRMEREQKKIWDKARMDHMAEKYPKETGAELEKPDGGFFNSVDKEARAAGLEKARAEKIKLDRTAEARQRNLNHVTDKDMTWKYTHQALTQSELEKNRNNMTDGRYRTLSEKISKASYIAQDEPKEYSRMMDILSDKNTTEREFIDELLKAKLSQAQRMSLMELGTVSPDKDPVFKSSLKDDLDRMQIVQEWKEQMVDKKKQANSTVWEMLKKYTDNNKEKAAQLSMQIKETDADKLPQAAVAVIKQDAVKSNPHVAQATSQGMLMVDSKGNKARVYPDGTVEEL